MTLRLHADMLAALDAWRLAQPDVPGRAEAIRRLLAEKLGQTIRRGGTRDVSLKEAAAHHAHVDRVMDRLRAADGRPGDRDDNEQQ